MISRHSLHFVPANAAVACLLAVGLSLSAAGAWAQQAVDKNAERAARRAQLQLQSLQQQVQDAQAAKAKVESDRAALDKQLGDQSKQLMQLKGALPRATQSLKAAEAERARLAAAVAALEQQLADQKASSAEAMAAKDRELSQMTKTRDEQQGLAKRKFDEQVVNVGECTSKNDRLIRLNAELLDRYRNKTTADVLKQREPALGFGDVQMFNLIQDYRDKADAERYSPPINR
jgi:chromosome segregation ATPase